MVRFIYSGSAACVWGRFGQDTKLNSLLSSAMIKKEGGYTSTAPTSSWRGANKYQRRMYLTLPHDYPAFVVFIVCLMPDSVIRTTDESLWIFFSFKDEINSACPIWCTDQRLLSQNVYTFLYSAILWCPVMLHTMPLELVMKTAAVLLSKATCRQMERYGRRVSETWETQSSLRVFTLLPCRKQDRNWNDSFESQDRQQIWQSRGLTRIRKGVIGGNSSHWVGQRDGDLSDSRYGSTQFEFRTLNKLTVLS